MPIGKISGCSVVLLFSLYKLGYKYEFEQILRMIVQILFITKR